MTPEPTTGTVAVRSSVSAWRVAVVGVTALLAVGIGSVLGSFLVGGGGAAPGAAAAYVPADAPVYVEMRLDLSAQLEADLAAIIQRFPGGEMTGTVLDKVGELVDSGFEAGGLELRWADDVAPWFNGRLAVAILDIPSVDVALAPYPMSSVAPTQLIFLGATDRAAAIAATDRLRAAAEESGASVTSIEHDGVTVWSVEHSATETISYAVAGDQVLMGGTDAVTLALDVGAGREPSLADRPDLADLAGRLPADWVGFIATDLSSMWTQLRADLESAQPGMGALLDTFTDSTPTVVAGIVEVAGDRAVLHVATDPPTGEFAPSTADRGLAAHMPADTLYYAEGGNLGPVLAALVSGIKEAVRSLPDVPVAELDQVEAALGADLEEFVSWVGDGALAVGWDGEQAYAGLALVPTDAAAARQRLGQLASFVRLAMLDPSSGISMTEETVAGTEVTTIHFGAEPDPTMPIPTDLALQYAIGDDLVLIGVGERFVERSLGLDAAGSLASSERFVAATTEVGGATNAGMTYLDLAGIREAIEAALPAEVFTLGYDEVRPYLEPFDYLAQVSRVEGDALVTRVALVLK